MKNQVQRKYNHSGSNIYEICGQHCILVIHHIRGRKIPNAEHISNKTNICSNCHNNVHNGIIIIEDKILTSNGYELIWHHYKEPSLTNRDAKPYLQ
jgi:hypothetical protein